MKKTSKFFAMLLMGTFAMGFTSCSDDDDDKGGGDGTSVSVSEALMRNTAQTYINDVVNPTYTALANASAELRDACADIYAKAQANTLTDADVVAACDAFKEARREWERSEAFLYGAATDNEIDPHIDSWPLDQSQLVSALNDKDIIAGINGSNPGQFVYEENGDFDSVLGFHGLEFVLFRNGAERKAADFSVNETYTGMTSVRGIDELAFAAAVSQDICNMTTLLEYGWLGSSISSEHNTILTNAPWVTANLQYKGLSPRNISYGDYLLAATTSNGYFPTWQETMQNILVGGCSNICQEVYQQKLGQAYRVATGNGGTTEDGEAESIDYIESPYSKRSFVDYQDNIYSIKNVLFGTRDITATTPVANSLMAIMRDNNYPRYSNISTALTNAINALESAKNSGKAFVDAPDDPQVKTCIDAVNVLDDELNNAGTWFLRNVSVVK